MYILDQCVHGVSEESLDVMNVKHSIKAGIMHFLRQPCKR